MNNENKKAYVQEGYWVGFDTAHCYDWTPQWNEGEYKSVDYVKGEIKTLVSQIKKYFNLKKHFGGVLFE